MRRGIALAMLALFGLQAPGACCLLAAGPDHAGRAHARSVHETPHAAVHVSMESGAAFDAARSSHAECGALDGERFALRVAESRSHRSDGRITALPALASRPDLTSIDGHGARPGTIVIRQPVLSPRSTPLRI